MYGGYPYLVTSTTGSDSISANSSVPVGFSAGQTGWVKATFDVDNGAGGKTARFYTAPDQVDEPSSWTELGTAQTSAGTTSIYSSNSQLEIGSNLIGGSPATGTIYRAIVRNGIGGTTVFDANFATQTANAATFNESANNAIVTVSSAYAVPVTVATTRYAYGVPNVQFTAQGTQALTANTVYYQPFEVTAPITVDFMALEITTAAAAGGTLRLGIYAADSNLQPTGSVLFDSEAITVTASATGIVSKQGTAVTLQPGLYVTAANTSVAFTARTALGGQTAVATAMGASLFTVLNSATQTTGAYPVPATPWTTRAGATGAARHVAQLRWR